MHESHQNGITIEAGKEEFVRRFSGSHEITIIAVQPLYAPDVEAAVLEKLGLIGLAECMDEKRNPGQLWMWLEACSFHR
jgi:hypothetical protein